MIALVAISNNNIIGIQNRLPWHIPEDLKFFRKTTIGHILVMGRLTFESLPGYGLKDRICVVLTRTPSRLPAVDSSNEVIFVDSDNLDAVIKNLGVLHPSKLFFVIGGKQIYELFADSIGEFVVTYVHKDVVGDTSLDLGLGPNFEQWDSRVLDKWYSDGEDCWVSRVAYKR